MQFRSRVSCLDGISSLRMLEAVVLLGALEIEVYTVLNEVNYGVAGFVPMEFKDGSGLSSWHLSDEGAWEAWGFDGPGLVRVRDYWWLDDRVGFGGDFLGGGRRGWLIAASAARTVASRARSSDWCNSHYDGELSIFHCDRRQPEHDLLTQS
ncbi:hypothetical protein Tco_0345085 [Tanacetum coccineum]